MNETTRAANNNDRILRRVPRVEDLTMLALNVDQNDSDSNSNSNSDAGSRSDSKDDNRNDDEIHADLLGLLEVFPDMSIDFALELLQQENNDIEKVLERITEEDEEYQYPRDSASSEEEDEEDDDEETRTATNDEGEIIVEERQQQEQRLKRPATIAAATTTYDYNFMSPKSFKPAHRYKLQSLEQLLFRFPFLDKRMVSSIFQSSSYHFAIAHNNICQSILAKVGREHETIGDDGGGKKFDEMLLCVLFDDDKGNLQKNEIELLVECLKKTKNAKPINNDDKRKTKMNIKIKTQQLVLSLSPRFVTMGQGRHRRNNVAPRVTCPILMQELRYVNEKTMELKGTLEAGIEKRNLREEAIQNGTAMVCSCCYDEYAFEGMVSCRDEGHLFCQDCLCSYFQTQVFGNGSFGFTKGDKKDEREIATEIQCCAGECSSGFDQWALRKALKEKVLQKYDELQYQTTIEKAGLSENMCGCPRCDLMFEVPEEANFFVCPIECCDYEACRHCGEAPHVGKTCDEVEREGEGEGRQRVEEAATAAIIRKCPSCKKGILKEDGCNKMQCPCGTKFCYCCGKEIDDYSHFCQVPHCDHSDKRKCRHKCPLWTGSFELEIQDREAARGAAMAEAARVEAENAAREGNEKPPHSNKWKSLGIRRRGGSFRGVDVESILAVPGRF